MKNLESIPKWKSVSQKIIVLGHDHRLRVGNNDPFKFLENRFNVTVVTPVPIGGTIEVLVFDPSSEKLELVPDKK